MCKTVAERICEGKTTLGIEFGSTKIKAVLIDERGNIVATGSSTWENQFINGIWTYSIDDIWSGLRACYSNLANDVLTRYGVPLSNVRSIGISGMMHGYFAFDANGNLLVPFRTWRNTITKQASEKLSKLFGFYIPQRWGIAHLYQAILNEERHVSDIAYITTLSGYVHWKLTGQKVLGVGDASGLFPVNADGSNYNEEYLEIFDRCIARCDYSWQTKNILPKVLPAGKHAGKLTYEGAKRLDPTGTLQSGCPLCPPEGDAGTGMTATNCVSPGTCNISAGTSIFAMTVMEKGSIIKYPEVDIVASPAGLPVAMIHCNNCTSDLDSWMELFQELFTEFGILIESDRLYETLLKKAELSDMDCGGLLLYNYFSGEHITGLKEGRPLLIRKPNSTFSIGNLMHAHLFAAICTLKVGLNILRESRKVNIKKIVGHGGLFKTKHVLAKALAAATSVPVVTFQNVDNGGAWGAALLASYMAEKGPEDTLDQYLSVLFNLTEYVETVPEVKEVEMFSRYFQRFVSGLPVEKLATDLLI